MGIKIIIANNNDILYNSLANIVAQDKSKIEIRKIPMNEAHSFIQSLKRNENIIVLDCTYSITFYMNFLKNSINRLSKTNIIILVIDSKYITNATNHEKANFFFRKKRSKFSLLDMTEIVLDSAKESLKIERNIDSIFWKLGFTPYFKGTGYLKDAISLAYNGFKLQQDMNKLVKKIAEKNRISNEKVVRSAMDKSLNSMLDYTNTDTIYDIFGDDYDGRKISVKYFIDLCIRYLEEQKESLYYKEKELPF